jgi:DNA-binding CsgD family transcriptional regulator
MTAETTTRTMTKHERLSIVAILTLISIATVADLITDFSEGVRWWHVLTEGLIGLAALAGVFLLMRDSFTMKRRLEAERRSATELRVKADAWRQQARKYSEGLSEAIDRQLNDWHLTASEKEVALLLLKGLSSKEIAEVRKTTEKTVRVQSMAVYSKSGLAGRSELAAFFLEDLLAPPRSEEPALQV